MNRRLRGSEPEHPAHGATRAFGRVALVGLVLLVLCVPIGVVTDRVTGSLEHPVFLVSLGAGMFLVFIGWLMWGSWSTILKREEAPFRRIVRFSLVATVTMTLGAVCFLGGGVLALLHRGGGSADAPFLVLIGLWGLGALLLFGTFAGAAVYGGIALGGPRWWWVGTLLSAALFTIGAGLLNGSLPLLLSGAAALIISAFGYRRALKSGLAQGRTTAVDSAPHYREHFGW